MSVILFKFVRTTEGLRYQGGVIDDDEEAITRRLNAVVQRLAGEKA